MPNSVEKTLPTAKDVAKLAEVSTATVSRYFSSPGRIKKETAARISEAIENLGYVPDLNARALASRRADVIGAIVPTLENAIFAEGIEAMQSWLNERNITLLVASSNYDPDQEYQQVLRLIAHGISGLLLIGTERHSKTLDLIKSRKVPYCLSWCFRKDYQEPQIGFDNYTAGAAMAKEIVDRGHKQIGIISGIRKWNDRSTDRVQGALDYFEQNGIAIPDGRLLEVEYNHEFAAKTFSQLIQDNPDITCVFCANDVIAAGAVRQAYNMKISVPEQISITGFDDIALAQSITPSLTTVRLRHKHMGELAGERLLAAVISGIPVKCENIPFSIVIRESLGHCPNQS